MKLFSPQKPFKFVAKDILGPLPNTKTRNKFIVVMTYSYSKLTMAIPNRKTTAIHVARIFVGDWIMPNGVPDRLVTDTGPAFVEKFLNALCVALGTRLIKSTVYHLIRKGGLSSATNNQYVNFIIISPSIKVIGTSLYSR